MQISYDQQRIIRNAALEELLASMPRPHDVCPGCVACRAILQCRRAIEELLLPESLPPAPPAPWYARVVIAARLRVAAFGLRFWKRIAGDYVPRYTLSAFNAFNSVLPDGGAR